MIEKKIIFILRNINFFLVKQKYLAKLYIPPKLWDFLARLIFKFRIKQYSERIKTFGKQNELLNFFVIRRRPPGWGFFSNVFFVLQGIIYAEKNNYIPVVDMENYWMAELNESREINGTRNSWCYFFEQISPYSLVDVYKSKNVTLSDGHSILESDHWLSLKNPKLFSDAAYLEKIGDLIKKYLFMNEPTLNEYQNLKEELNWNSADFLGVFIRGTGYYEYIPGIEGKWTNFENLVNEIFKILRDNKLKQIYVSTEDFRIYQRLTQKLTSFSVVPSIRYRSDLNIQEWLSSQKLTYDNGILPGYEATKKYVMEIYLLSECNNLIVTPSNASAFALANSNLSIGDHRVVMHDRVIKLNNP